MIWLTGSTHNDALNMQKNHEYIHVHAKKLYPKASILETKNIIKNKIYSDEKGEFLANIALSSSPRNLNERPALGTSIYWREKDKSIIFKNDYNIKKARTSNVYSEIYDDEDKVLTENDYICIRPPMEAW